VRPVAIRDEGTSVSSASPSPRACLDCGSPLSGKFCSVCGQKDEPLKRGLKELALEFFQHPLVDTKLWRSLLPLLLRPGALTLEYLAGRRTRYVRPLKLYLTISVAFFALLALLVPQERYLHVDPNPPPSGADVGQKPKEGLHLPIRWLDERFQRNSAALEGPEGAAARRSVATRISGFIPKMVFILLPLSAVLFKFFWWRRYFVEHLVFTLHLHSFAFAVGMFSFFDWAPVTGVVLVWSCVYVLLAFKRVYQEGWGKTLAKLVGLMLAYLLLFSVGMLVTALSAVVAA
jgi:hypothetical protein